MVLPSVATEPDEIRESNIYHDRILVKLANLPPFFEKPNGDDLLV